MERKFLAGEATELIFRHAQAIFGDRVEQLKSIPLNEKWSSDADRVLETLADNPGTGITGVKDEIQRLIYERYVQAITRFEMVRDKKIAELDPSLSDDDLLSFVIRNWLVGMEFEFQSVH